jgi:hypothetical protein
MEIFFEGMHFSLRERVVILIAATAVLAFVMGMLGGWIGSYWGARRGARKEMRKALASPPSRNDAPVAALAQTVDVMAVEVERIAEGQRFLVKLLSEREAAQMHLPASSAQRSPGTTTPH